MDIIPSLDSIAQWQLLRIVCPIFESDLSWKSLRSAKVDLAVVEDTAKFLKIFIREIKIQIQPDYILSESTYPEFLRHINALLSTLETLVKRDILQLSCDDKFTGKDTVESSSFISLSGRCPKLVALAGLIETCNQISPNAYDEYLHLVQDAVTFKQTRYELQRFVDEMQKTLCQDAPPIGTSTTNPSTRKLESRVNSSFRDYSKQLFDSLVRHLQPCSARGSTIHRAKLHLKGFTDMNESDIYPDLSMLLEGCSDNKTWQQMYYSMSYQSTGTNQQTDDICQLAQETYERREILKIVLNGDGFWDMSDLMFGQEPEYPDTDLTVSLNDLLKLGWLKNPYRFYPNDKRILAYILAQALLCLYDGPWLQHLWTLENLLYRCHTDGTEQSIYNIHQPYISCVLLEQLPSIGALDSKHRYPLILSFAKLLVELETGEEIETLGKNEKGGPNLLGALLHYCKTWSKHQLPQGYASALDACVMFQKYFKEDQIRNPQITIQEVILTRIVHPLEMEIDLNGKKDWGFRHLRGVPVVDHDIKFKQHTQDASRATLSPVAECVSTTKLTRSGTLTKHIVQNIDGTGVGLRMRIAQSSLGLKPKTRDEFHIAIICALPLEADAVRALFDETYDEYGQTYRKRSGDANIYTTGRIDQHNIVLCHMPRMGTTSAATVASSLQVSYTQIQLALLVGICGAVPFTFSNEEIILGDIILSDSVIKYDFGRQYPDGFQRKMNEGETLGRPNREIQGLLQKLKTHETKSNFQNLISQYLQVLERDKRGEWCHPGVVNDILFESTYLHDPLCDRIRKRDCKSLGCVGTPVPRTRLTEERIQPFVHIGKIASADMVMQSAKHRDKLAEKEGVIGFEMEGAGVCENMPCLIIKGVCDYADSHKNKIWQAYAAATAASGAKAFLKYWTSSARELFD